MRFERRTCADPISTAEACADYIIERLDETLALRGHATLAISGGTTPRPMFIYLAHSRVPWNRVHIFWVDERAVPPTDPQSNYKLATETLLVPVGIPQRNVHRIHGELAPQVAARAYAQEIREFLGLGRGELPAFDVVHRGMGPDGHTASLFPDDLLIENREDIATAVYLEQKKQWRVTLLPGPLLAAHNTVMLVTGADKAETLRDVFQEPVDVMRYPAQLPAPRTVWFVDAAAASLLDGS